MIVVDASAAVLGLLAPGESRELLASEQLHAPHLIDVEIAQALRGRALGHKLGDRRAHQALTVWSRIAVTRHEAPLLLHRTWELRSNLSAYDALCVALAEVLTSTLVTADARLARAPGIRCDVRVVTS